MVGGRNLRVGMGNMGVELQILPVIFRVRLGKEHQLVKKGMREASGVFGYS